jgi:hypothetical protein
MGEVSGTEEASAAVNTGVEADADMIGVFLFINN